jgi:DNA recombination protein Rad52
MSNFSARQIRALAGKLDRRHVQSRNVEGKDISYIEGWFAISEANAIFGFGHWDREMVHFERAYERKVGETSSCAYLARVKIRVHSGGTNIIREGAGWGAASGRNLADIHERAIKAAETDATKRALATFGNRFGLCLYDKEQGGVSGAKPTNAFAVYDPSGAVFADNLSPEAFCSCLRQLIDKDQVSAELALWYAHNISQISKLREAVPYLKSTKNEHYADILERLIVERLSAKVADQKDESAEGRVLEFRPSKIAPGPQIDKSVLKIATDRRYRDKSHLRAVAAQPCLICGRVPSHAHHLKFAQSHGVAQKVSDEFVVPLCAMHHDELHRSVVEIDWWRTKAIDPLPIALELWSRSRQPDTSWRGRNDVAETSGSSLPKLGPCLDERMASNTPTNADQ